MKKKLLVDLHAKIELPVCYWRHSLEEKAQEMEREAKDLQEFIRDHRSRDSYQINIVREYKDICDFCKRDWEEDTNGCPVCCNKAIEEWESKNKIQEVSNANQ